ncbi:hypothetical protein BpHYR1_026775 [Brachionus plicatilis]|uniref:RNA-directed DNA polymerase from mobile element jockey-like n=1 Tax=Brachionus plicatilis TaxID=10195 RepID=A0A3M7QAS0_BRAPC|nr:hypothetical protein BpHYR1_026775 [Brachionus plicatilis]
MFDKKKYSDLLIVGDFNHPKIKLNSKFGFVEGKENSMVRNNSIAFLETIQSNFLTQHLHLPIFGENVLDIIFTEDSSRTNTIENGPHLSTPKKNKLHSVLTWDYHLECNIVRKTENRPAIEKGKYSKLNQHFEKSIKIIKEATSDIEEQCKLLMESYKIGHLN